MHDAWELRSQIREGVYQLRDYPVRITHLAHTDDTTVQRALKIAVRGLLERHMRRDATGPRHGVRAEGLCQGATAELQEACRVIGIVPSMADPSIH